MTETNGAMIEMIKVSKIYQPDIRALYDVSVSIAQGEMFFLIGMSGAGKTTFLKLLCNMETPTNGLIEIAGRDIHKLRGKTLARMRQKIGVAYQDFKLLTDRTVAENVAISMEVSYKKPQHIKKRVRDLLDRLALADKHDAITGELSRGEQQRVALARAFINQPQILFADEPTGNLDGINGEHIIDLLFGMNQTEGTTLILVTHDPELASHCDRVLSLQDGRMQSDTRNA